MWASGAGGLLAVDTLAMSPKVHELAPELRTAVIEQQPRHSSSAPNLVRRGHQVFTSITRLSSGNFTA
jgi:hypothetical protein